MIHTDLYYKFNSKLAGLQDLEYSDDFDLQEAVEQLNFNGGTFTFNDEDRYKNIYLSLSRKEIIGVGHIKTGLNLSHILHLKENFTRVYPDIFNNDNFGLYIMTERI